MSKGRMLSGLMLADRPPSDIVAWRRDPAGGDLAVRRERFVLDVAKLRAALAEHAPGRWIVYTEDSYAFGVALLAVWHAGQVALSPPNAQPGALARLREEAVGVLSDRPDLMPGEPVLDPLAAGALAGQVQQRLGALDREAPALELFTSGTTGVGKSVVKRLRHLEDEVAYLEERFGPALGGARVFGTASHQHLYGLLFRVLWPLAVGRPFQAETLLHAGELFPRMLASADCALASAPAHLKRMAEQAGLADLGSCCRVVFSSGGPLPPEVADRWAAGLGSAPIEIFGSTETGGVAWRQQLPGPERLAYTPFERVAVERDEADGCLRIRSPFESEGNAVAGFTMGDRIRLLPDKRFVLEGRSDRVVKIGEKRISLPEMEDQLRAHPLVAEVALLPLEQAGETRVGAVVVLSAEGLERLESDGRRALGIAFAGALSTDWDRVLLPRVWRYVDALPENELGKATLPLLRALFSEVSAPAADRSAPRILGEERFENGLEWSCEVPDDLVYLEGHFPVQPIVPGVVQIAWAIALGSALLGAEPEIERIEALKFREVLGPGVRFRLRVELAAARGQLRFQLCNDESEFSSGRLVMARHAVAVAGGGSEV